MLALQAPTNAMLGKAAGSPVNAALVSFAVGTIALLVAAFVVGIRPSPGALRSLPWYAWAGGLYGAVFVALAAFAAPRLGVTSFLTIGIAGQLVMALCLDRIGAFGVDRVELSPTRLIGVGLVLAGVLLVRR
jgi:bacterial/archaeal transporter family-2 protein